MYYSYFFSDKVCNKKRHTDTEAINRGFNVFSREISPIFIASTAQKGLSDKTGLFANLFSTHPPILKRIEILLKQAHATAIDLKIKDKRATHKEKWRIYNKGKWSNPLILEELLALNYFNPQSWLCLAGTKNVIKAVNDKTFAEHFLSRIRQDPVIKDSIYNCPRCIQPLVIIEYEGCEIYKCNSCNGNLVSWINLQKILARKEKEFSELKSIEKNFRKSTTEKWKILSGSRKSELKCPKCKYFMAKSFYNFSCFITVDRCMKCGEIWFDEYELELLQKEYEKGQ